jgi:hypothetical protein
MEESRDNFSQRRAHEKAESLDTFTPFFVLAGTVSLELSRIKAVRILAAPRFVVFSSLLQICHRFLPECF